MAAKTPWNNERANVLLSALVDAFDRPTHFSQVHSGGCLARDPECDQVLFISVIGAIRPGTNLDEARGIVKERVAAHFPGCKLKKFKIYDYVELEDGNISWIVTTEEHIGAALVHTKGPLTFIKMIEVFAESRGLKFGASGLKSGKDKFATPTEESLFETLGIEFVPPGDRDTVRTIAPVQSDLSK